MFDLKKFGFCLGAFALASSSYGAFSFHLSAGGLRDSNGAYLASGLLILAVDTDRDGFSIPTDTEFFQDADDLEVARWNFSEGGSTIPGEFLGSGVISEYNVAWEAGDPLALYWYPTLNKGDAAPVDGVKFGVFADPNGESTGDPWVLPADGSILYSLQFFAEGSILSTTDFASEFVAAATLEEGTALADLTDVATSPSKTTATSNSISWDLSGGAQGYTVDRRKIGGDWETVATLAAGVNSFVDTALSAGSTYEYRVVAENGFSAFESASSAQLFSERSQFRGVAIRSNMVVADSAKHAFGGVILSSGGPGAATTRKLHLQSIGNDTYNPSGSADGVFLKDPTINLYDQFAAAFTHDNDDWLGAASAEVTEMDDLSAVGRGNVLGDEATNRDSGLILDDAMAGDVGYAFIASPYTPSDPNNPKSNYNGVAADAEAVVSIYDAGDIDGSENDIRISKLAARGHVSDSTVFGMIGGLDIEGVVPKQVLLLGKGPHLETDDPSLDGLAITDPSLKLRLGGTIDVIAENDDWATASASSTAGVTVETDVDKIRAALSSTGNTLFDSHPKDSVMLLTLDPGTYTVELVGMNSGTREAGLGFIEIQEIE